MNKVALLAIRQYKLTSRSRRTSYILDFGCGDGRLVQAINKQGHHCIGVDPAISALKYFIYNPSNLYNSISQIPLDIDICSSFSHHVLEHIEKPENYLLQVHSRMSPFSKSFHCLPARLFFLEPHTRIPFFLLMPINLVVDYPFILRILLLLKLGPVHWKSCKTLPFADFYTSVCLYIQHNLFFHSYFSLKTSLLALGLNIKPILITELPSCPPLLTYLCPPFLTYLCSLFRSQYYVVSRCL